jgi:hypothetical protein
MLDSDWLIAMIFFTNSDYILNSLNFIDKLLYSKNLLQFSQLRDDYYRSIQDIEDYGENTKSAVLYLLLESIGK